MYNKEKGLTIYKASAGSGKTFRLAIEYLKLIIANPDAYKNILAVTFTNKATAEMKDRILIELFGIAKNLEESASYKNILLNELSYKDKSWTEDKLERNAQKALTLLLHDYSRFTFCRVMPASDMP